MERDPESEEIEKVRREEMRRGRRPVDSQTLAERKRMLAALREIVNYGTVEDLKTAMREYGLSEDSPDWTAALQIWNDAREQT